MFSNLATKVALKKAGIPTDAFSNIKLFPWADGNSSNNDTKSLSAVKKKSTSNDSNNNNNNNNNNKNSSTSSSSNTNRWPNFTVKSLPLTVQPWLTPKPPPIPVEQPPKVGDLAPLDKDRKIVLGGPGGKKTLIVFLRCVGCAFAQKQFLNLRALATRHSTTLTCIAVSHSSAAATAKWLDLLGGPRNVQIVIDEERAVYAAWGLGLGNVWYVFNPTSTVAGFKEKGWLGQRVANSLSISARVNPAGTEGADAGPTTEMGNKWQESGCWAVDGRGKVVWGCKAARSDEVLGLEEGVTALGIA
ncbi:hypothetical protein QBC42DRAFT_333945 [Cladorrhinum samala]|uniref:Alkyl hydroperoxide reductase subunit C/ Thiol specific antioxidant domain-containing protein n=1 Tax=Cladorrhinum samala TaxID=585594 RepID=A0AAV9HKM2_9PEZI|nr:hypothetical protein QBC42DRAFT_333945 [Cladorrhinum samala]